MIKIKLATYKLKRTYVGNNLLFSMELSGYKRLYRFEPLLEKFDKEKVCDILAFNSDLKKERQQNENIKIDNHIHSASMSVVYNYPPTQLTPHKFAIYKICQKLKKKLD